MTAPHHHTAQRSGAHLRPPATLADPEKRTPRASPSTNPVARPATSPPRPGHFSPLTNLPFSRDPKGGACTHHQHDHRRYSTAIAATESRSFTITRFPATTGYACVGDAATLIFATSLNFSAPGWNTTSSELGVNAISTGPASTTDANPPRPPPPPPPPPPP